MPRRHTYIIAEVGINHNGLIGNCHKLIDAAASSGCDAVKFQYFRPEFLYPRSAGRLNWKDGRKKYSYDIYKAAEKNILPGRWIKSLIRRCHAMKLDFFSSVFDRGGVDYLVGKGMRKIKLSSYTVTNLPLVEHCAKTRLPIIMSTGGSSIEEVREAVRTILKYHDNISLLHCVLSYPASLKQCNLSVMEGFAHLFPGIKVGYSDHTAEVSRAPVQAVYLGARLIEKHITLDKNMKGPDHFFALDPMGLKQMVKDIRKAERDLARGSFTIDKLIYGSRRKKAGKDEKYLRDFCFMSLFSGRRIKTGERIAAEDISILRPGKKERGLEPKYLKLFEDRSVRARKEIKFEDPITWASIVLR